MCLIHSMVFRLVAKTFHKRSLNYHQRKAMKIRLNDLTPNPCLILQLIHAHELVIHFQKVIIAYESYVQLITCHTIPSRLCLITR